MKRLTALLDCQSYMSFGYGCSSPTRLVMRAAELGYTAIALVDRNGVYGAVEAQEAGRVHNVKVLVGATIELAYEDATYPLIFIAKNRQGYEILNRLLTAIHAADKPVATLPMLLGHADNLYCLTGGRQGFLSTLLARRQVKEAEALLAILKGAFDERLYVQLYYGAYTADNRRVRKLRDFARANRVAVVAAPEVRYSTPELFRLHDTLICARLGITIYEPHRQRPQNDAEALPDSNTWYRLPALPFPYPEAIENAATIAQHCNLELLAQRLTPPEAHIPEGISQAQHLKERLYGALVEKYQGDALVRARTRLEEELTTMHALGLEGFFLVAAEVTDFCASRGIVASGRGSAAASITCYLLGITGVDPLKHNLLFERFLHTGRASLPDVDIDIGSSRRDEVLAWVEERFGAETQAMVCNRITYRLPLAIQDVGRGLGIPKHLRDELTKALGRNYRGLRPHRAREAQAIFDEVLGAAPIKETLLTLLSQMERGFVRHIAPHSGGVVLSKYPLSHYSPLERSSGGIKLIQFDKDHSEALGIIKLDLLGLRMLGVFERCREEVVRTEKTWLTLTDLPNEPEVWQNIQKGDTMGLFQIESPAQVNITVDLKPQSFIDLAHQVALIRPGPIQSGTVHPYVRRKRGLEPINYMHPALEPILQKTYGVLLFQEDIMRVAVHVAGFTWAEAETFRKKVSSYEDDAQIKEERQRFIKGCVTKQGMHESEALEIFALCASFRGYGFAESHAWAFGQHAYTSAWLRYHYPTEYFAALLTEDPGMWPRSTIVQAARRKGVTFLKVDINKSALSYRTEINEDHSKSIRVPLTTIDGISETVAKEIVLERLEDGSFNSLEDFYNRVAIKKDTLMALVRAGTFDTLLERRKAEYLAANLLNTQKAGKRALFQTLEDIPDFETMPVPERVKWDFELKGFNEAGIHPTDLFRQELLSLGAQPMARLPLAGIVTTAGVVVAKQRPPTAKGFAFYTIEDGWHRAQIVITPAMWDRHAGMLRYVKLLFVKGNLVRRGEAWSIQAEQLVSIVPQEGADTSFSYSTSTKAQGSEQTAVVHGGSSPPLTRRDA